MTHQGTATTPRPGCRIEDGKDSFKTWMVGIMFFACLLGGAGYLIYLDSNTEESRYERQVRAERRAYTAGTAEWFHTSTQLEKEAFYGNVCQEKYRLTPGTGIFSHCMANEQEAKRRTIEFDEN